MATWKASEMRFPGAKSTGANDFEGLDNPYKMSDPYGIPPNMFGIVPEELFGALGRVVMVAALLELQLLDLVTTLDQASQETHAGQSGTQLIKACRTLVDDLEPSLRAMVVPVLDRADDELAMRNAVVHSLWPSPTATYAYGWRPVTKSKRMSPGQANVAIEVSLPELGDLIRRTVRVVEDMVMIKQRVGNS